MSVEKYEKDEQIKKVRPMNTGREDEIWLCSVKKSAECDFFLNLMKKSLLFVSGKTLKSILISCGARLDEFANIGQIPNFDKLIATIRSREISASIILQSQSQLKAIYKDAAEIISDNCDSVLFLSGRGKNAKEISDALGKETIDSFNTSENRGSQTSHGLNYQKLGKDVP